MSQATKVREGQITRPGSMPGSGAFGRIGTYPRRARQFLRETRNQLRLVTWPGAREVYSTTVVVVITVAFFALFFWATDGLFSYVSQLILGHFQH